VLVPPGDVASLATALRALAEQPGRRAQLGQVAAESVRKRFSEEAVLSRWDALFAELQVEV
jgi:glycosyltransferase involved in cell wall biosynthesis